MVDLVAKRYVKALLIDTQASELETILQELQSLSVAFSQEKFVDILSSADVTLEQKQDLLLSFVPNCTDTTKNLIKLLGANKRLNVIESIAQELSQEVAQMNNSYEGIVYTSSELGSDYIKSLEEKFSHKFDVKLSLVQHVCEYNGIKVDIEGLGVEIGFSKDRLKTQMIEHILKAV